MATTTNSPLANATPLPAPVKATAPPTLFKTAWVIWVCIFFNSLVITLAAHWLVSPWKLDLRFDTDTFLYYDSQDFHAHGVTGGVRALTEPFFRMPKPEDLHQPSVLANEAKPVFVAALRLWGLITRWLANNEGAWLTRPGYFRFELCTFAAVAILTAWLGRRLGHPYVGMAAAWIVLLCPWSLVELYYARYKFMGMALLLATALAALRQTRASTVLAGLLAWAAFLTDNGCLMYAFVVGLFVMAFHLRDWRKALTLGGYYLLGILLPYVCFDLIGRIWFPTYQTPLEVTIGYYQRFVNTHHFSIYCRPPAEAREQAPKYPFISLYVVRHNSWVVFGLLLGATVAVYNQCLRQGWRALWTHPGLQRVLVLWLPLTVAWAVIELKPGAQLGHSFFTGYPVAILGLLLFWIFFVRSRRWWNLLWVVLAVVYVGEISWGLVRQRQVYHGLENTVAAVLDPHNPHQKIAMVYTDGHIRIIQHLLTPEFSDRIVILRTFADLARLSVGEQVPVFTLGGPGLAQFNETRLAPGDRVEYILCGPVIETLSYAFPVKGQREFIDRDGTTIKVIGQTMVRFESPVKIPFQATYPLFLFDDEWHLWVYISRLVDDNTCWNGKGSVTLMKVTYPPAPPGH